MKTKADIIEQHTQDKAKFENERHFPITSVVSMLDEYAEQFKSKWIKVTERLPEIVNEELGYSDYVLAYSDSFTWGKWYISRYYHHSEMWEYEKGHDVTYNPISSWTPLPDAPES